MDLASMLANALSVSPGYQRKEDARYQNEYEGIGPAIQQMLAGMGRDPGPDAGATIPASPLYSPGAPQMNPMLPPGPQINPMLPYGAPSSPTLPQRALIPYGAPRR